MAAACDWCGRPIPGRARADSVTCSKPCRQAKQRFTAAVGHADAVPGPPLRLAYADPPYPGKAWLYHGHPDYAGEVDHAALICRLALQYPDGWALSTSAAALPAVLPLCPPGVRVGAWHRGPRVNKDAAWPLAAWEPVIYHGGRPLPDGRPRADSIVCGAVPARTLPGRVIGMKPPEVIRWIFDLLGAGPGDTFADLFPGSGAVTRAWRIYTADTPLFALSELPAVPSRITGAG